MESIRDLSYRYGVRIRAVHVPCLVVTQHVWGWNPEVKLRRSVDMAVAAAADVVVVHPPFRWQREYAATFPQLVAGFDRRPLADGRPGPAVTVENMFAVEAFGRRVEPFRWHDDPSFSAFGSISTLAISPPLQPQRRTPAIKPRPWDRPGVFPFRAQCGIV